MSPFGIRKPYQAPRVVSDDPNTAAVAADAKGEMQMSYTLEIKWNDEEWQRLRPADRDGPYDIDEDSKEEIARRYVALLSAMEMLETYAARLGRPLRVDLRIAEVAAHK